MVALDHVEAHLAAIFDDAHVNGAQALELIDVIAIGIGIAARSLAGVVFSEPHHLGLGAVTQAEAMSLLELVVDAAKIAAAVGGQIAAGIFALLAVAKQ